MLEFKLGEYVEVGIGESPYDEDGYSYYFQMDKEGYCEFEIMQLFESKGNVLYVNKVDDESSIAFAGDMKFSDFLRETSKCEYVKIELEVELPEDYNESEIDKKITDAIYSLNGQVLNSKEYKKYKEHIKIELEVELPEDYDESEIDEEISDVICSIGGEVLDSKEYKKIIPTNI